MPYSIFRGGSLLKFRMWETGIVCGRDVYPGPVSDRGEMIMQIPAGISYRCIFSARVVGFVKFYISS
jgi:hypothetical protein